MQKSMGQHGAASLRVAGMKMKEVCVFFLSFILTDRAED